MRDAFEGVSRGLKGFPAGSRGLQEVSVALHGCFKEFHIRSRGLNGAPRDFREFQAFQRVLGAFQKISRRFGSVLKDFRGVPGVLKEFQDHSKDCLGFMVSSNFSGIPGELAFPEFYEYSTSVLGKLMVFQGF